MLRKFSFVLFGFLLFTSVLTQCTTSSTDSELPRRKVIKIRESMFKVVKQSREIEKVKLEYSYLEDPAWEKNEGQIPSPEVKYYAHVSWGYVLVTEDSIWYYVVDSKEGPPEYSSVCIGRESYVGGLNFTFTPLGQIDEGKINYFIGSDPSKWVMGVERFRKLNLGEIYPGVELELEIKDGEFVKKFLVESSEALKKVHVEWEGIPEELDVSHLELYGTDKPKNNPKYEYLGEGVYTISFPESLDGPFTIINKYDIIDEKCGYFSFGFEWYMRKRKIILADGKLYVASSQYFPRFGGIIGFHPKAGFYHYGDVVKEVPFVCKFDEDLNLISKSYIIFKTGSGYSWGLAYYPNYGVYLCGLTSGNDLPLKDKGYQSEHRGMYDVFIILFSEDLKSIKSSTYVSREGGDTPLLRVNSRGVYVAMKSERVPHGDIYVGPKAKSITGVLYVVLLDHNLRRKKGSFVFSLLNRIKLKGFALGDKSVYLLTEGFFRLFNNLTQDEMRRLSLTMDLQHSHVIYLISLSSDLSKLVAGRVVLLGRIKIPEISLYPYYGKLRVVIATDILSSNIRVFPGSLLTRTGYKPSKKNRTIILAELDPYLSVKGFLAMEMRFWVGSVRVSTTILRNHVYATFRVESDLGILDVPLATLRVRGVRLKPFSVGNCTCSYGEPWGSIFTYDKGIVVPVEFLCDVSDSVYHGSRFFFLPFKVFENREREEYIYYTDLKVSKAPGSSVDYCLGRHGLYVIYEGKTNRKVNKGVYGVSFAKWLQDVLVRYRF